MIFALYTLVDITETKKRKDEEYFAWKQQQNFNTLFGLLSLRVNTLYDHSPKCFKDKVDKYNFGTNYKGLQNIWEFQFYSEFEDSLSIEVLQKDFNLVPFVDNLTETAKFQKPIFRTTDPKLNNIFFTVVDK